MDEDLDHYCLICGRYDERRRVRPVLSELPAGTTGGEVPMTPTKTPKYSPATDPDKLLEYAVGIFDTAAICAGRETDPARRELLEQRCEEIKEIITVLDAQCG